MSTPAKLTLAASIVFTTSIIAWVHMNQEATHRNMIQGVVNEETMKRLETNRRELEEQQIREAKLRMDEKKNAQGGK